MRLGLVSSLTIVTLLANAVLVMSMRPIRAAGAQDFVGGVYVMSNDLEKNSIIAYGRRSNGTLENIGSFRTGGKGAAIDIVDGIDAAPGLNSLLSAFSVILTPDKRFVIAVNAGSSSVSVFQILQNFRLRLRSVRRVARFGPVSVAFSGGVLYASSAEPNSPIGGEFTSSGFRGALTGFKLTKSGKLKLIKNSVRRLSTRPSAIQFSPDGRSLVVSSVAAGSVDLDTTRVDEISVFRVVSGGLLSKKPIDTATSTSRNNPEGRNLPGAIGFQIVRIRGVQYVVVTETRFQSADGNPPEFQTSSISTWRLTSEQKLIPVQLDVLVGTSFDVGQAATCWIEFSKTLEYFWVANTGTGTISSFSFKDGQSTLVEEVAGNAPIPIDLWRSRDGRFLYQLSPGGPGAVDVFEVANEGRSPDLTKIQTVEEDVLGLSVQGIVAI